jgi:hypothetical protein
MTDLDSSTERILRMKETWRGPTATEASAARRRFFGSRPAPRPPRWSVGLVFATLFAGGLAFASVGVVATRFVVASGSTSHEPSPTPSKRVRPVIASAPPPAIAPLEQAIEAPQPPSEARLEDTGTAASARAIPSRRPNRPAQSPSHLWAAAAEAMRTGDLAAAERALTELTRNADPTTRDQATLSLAEELLAQGRVDEARPLLQRLMAHGSTPFVRKRAADALGAKDEGSTENEPGTN